ncbi:MAG: hypothetical protein V7L17_29330 [Nostoc sp.]|uniref:hypothetical protein n=1 Tax=Nostoc sp. TaxID=1180 RepID=UPI00267FEC1B
MKPLLSLICEDFIYKIPKIFILHQFYITGAENQDAPAIADGKLVFRLCPSF